MKSYHKPYGLVAGHAIVFLVLALLLFNANGFGVVGYENIEWHTKSEFERDHETILSEEQERRLEERLLEQMQKLKEEEVPQEKEGEGERGRERKQLTEEEKRQIAQEITKLQLELMPQRKTWRDRMQTEPYLRTSYDSNILHENKNPKSDIIIETGGKATFDFGTNKTRADLQYRGSRMTFLKEAKQNRWEHDLATELGYRISSKSRADVYYRANMTSDNTSEIKSLLQRLQQTVGGGLNYRLSKKTGARIRLSHSRTDFLDKTEKSNASYQTQFGPELDYFISRKTAIFGRYSFGLSGGGADNSNKAVAHDFSGGIRGKIAPKTTALVDLGVTSQKNEGGVGGQNTTFAGQLILRTEITSKTDVEVLMHRGMSQAVDTEGTNFFVTTKFGLKGTTQFTRKLLGQIELSLRRNSFDRGGSLNNPSQKDTIFSAFLRTQYRFRQWLLMGLEYAMDFADSTERTSEYVAHRVTVDMHGRF